MRVYKGDIFYVNLNVLSGSIQKGRRPVVVVSNNKNNMFSPNVTVVPITSKNKKWLPIHVEINNSALPMKVHGIVLCEQIMTVSKEMLGDFMCSLSPFLMNQIDYALKRQLGL